MAGSAVALPLDTYPVGTILFPSTNIPGSLSSVKVVMDTTNHTDPACLVVMSVDVSQDNGVTWRQVGGMSRTGGPNVSPQGPQTTAGFTANFPTGSGRRVRGSIDINGAPLTFSVTVSWT